LFVIRTTLLIVVSDYIDWHMKLFRGLCPVLCPIVHLSTFICIMPKLKQPRLFPCLACTSSMRLSHLISAFLIFCLVNSCHRLGWESFSVCRFHCLHKPLNLYRRYLPKGGYQYCISVYLIYPYNVWAGLTSANDHPVFLSLYISLS